MNMCEVDYDIHISLNFSFKFVGIIFILFNIKMLSSINHDHIVCHIYISNDMKFYKTP